MDYKAQASCIKRYESLKKLENDTPQSRGQKFNQLIADVLQAHNVLAFANHRSIGEIDVSFRIEDKRYLLEAKWESSPINNDPVDKLAGRINLRVPGNYGFVLSMSGFTRDARELVKYSSMGNIILLGADIFEALLLGTIDAEKIFDSLVDLASFEGLFCPTLQDIFRMHFLTSKKALRIDPSSFCQNPSSELIEALRPDGNISEYDVIFSNLPAKKCGISACNSKCYLTLDDGVYLLEQNDLKKIIDNDLAYNRAFFSESRNSLLFIYPGSVLEACQDGTLKPLTKAYPGSIQLFQSGKNIHLFSNGWELFDSPPRILKFVDGKQSEVCCDYKVSTGSDAAIVNENEYVICGSSGVRLYRNNQEVWHVDSINCSAINVDRNRILFLENGVRLKSVDFHGKDLHEIASFRLGGSVGDFAVIGNDEYIFHLYYHEDQERKSCIVRVKIR
ncbi:restriction endonuclease [Gimesia sp.]|uniref:restriction endonuclease n=1 Tax=Gimesia sp. TaxID=2024833 RepID=UPI003A908F06